jgi:hypothetical protein
MYGNIQKNQQKLFLAVGIVLISTLFSVSTIGCATRPVIVATDESIIAGQVSTARIEAINGEVRRILQQYDSLIGGEIGKSIRGIDEALEALDRYDEFVQQCIRSLREIERGTRTGETDEGILVSSMLDRLNSLSAELDRQRDYVRSLDQASTSTPVVRHSGMTDLARETARRVK